MDRYSFGTTILVFAFVAGSLRFWNIDGWSVGALPLSALGLILAAPTLLRALRERHLPAVSVRGAAYVLPLAILSDWFARGYSFYPGIGIRGELILGLIIGWWCVYHFAERTVRVLAFATPIVALWAFFSSSSGAPLLHDDHASFFYRIEMLKRTFPNFPSYTTLWNAGIEARDYFPTGAFNIFLLFAPIVYALPLVDSYNAIVGILIFVLLPCSAFFGARFAGSSKPVALIASILCITSSLLWYRWALKYGAMGFCTSAVLFPLNVGLFSRIVHKDEELTWPQATLFVASSLLMLLWSLSAVAFVPLLFFGLFQVRRAWKKRYVPQIALAVLLVYIPWAVGFFTVSNVTKFLVLNNYAEKVLQEGSSIEESPRDLTDPWSGKMEVLAVRGDNRPFTFASVVDHIRELTVNTNLLLLLLSLPGFWILRTHSRIIYAPLIGWLFLLAFVGTPLKPQLELDRMYMIATFLLAVPAATAIWSLLSDSSGKRGLASLTFALLFISIFSTTAIIHNRKEEKYTFTPSAYFALADAISRFGGSGRTLFSGFILHEAFAAHIAPLAFFSQRPLVASVPTHSVWRRADVMPPFYRDGGIESREKYFDLMNATTVVAHETSWIEYFDHNPTLYKFVWSDGRFKMYQRTNASATYFLEGDGSVTFADEQVVRIRPRNESVVVKYNYLPFLESSGCVLGAKQFPGDIVFISLEQCKVGEEITIRLAPLWKRVLLRTF